MLEAFRLGLGHAIAFHLFLVFSMFFGKKRFSGNSTLQFNRGTTPISLEIAAISCLSLFTAVLLEVGNINYVG